MSLLSRVILSSLLLSTTGWMGACASSPIPPSVANTGEAESTTVTVTARDLVSVIVIEGIIASSPLVIVSTPNAGIMRFDEKTVSSVALAAGTRIGTVDGNAVVLPFAGRVEETTVPSGAQVVAHSPVASVAYAGFGVEIHVPAEQLFRLYTQPSTALVSLTSGAAGVTCALHPLAEDTLADELPSFSCLLPLEVAAVPGLSARVGIETANVTDALAVPVSAVLGSADRGVVTLIRGTERIRTDVELGISDGSFVQILSGLSAGDLIAGTAPSIRP